MAGVERVRPQRNRRDGQDIVVVVGRLLLVGLDPRQKTAERAAARTAAATTTAAAAASPPPSTAAVRRRRRRFARRGAERGRRRDRLPVADPGAVGHGGRYHRARRADYQEHHAADKVPWCFIIIKLGGYPRLRPGFPCGNIIIINVLVNKSDIVARVKLLKL